MKRNTAFILFFIFFSPLAICQDDGAESEIGHETKSLIENYKILERRITTLETHKKNSSVVSETTVPTPSKFSYRGHFQFRTEGARNVKGVFNTRQEDQSFFRFRTYLTFNPDKKVEFNLTPQATKGFGENVNNASTSGTNVHTPVTFFEANINYRISDYFSMKLGRQEIFYGDHLVIGTIPWDNAGRSFDALRFNLKHEKGWSELMYSKTENSNTPFASSDDVDLMVFYNSWSLNEYLKATDLYFINQNDKRSESAGVNMAGMRIKGSSGPLFYRTENGIQKGQRLYRDAFQTNVELGAGYKGTQLSFEYSLAGEDYRQLYPTAHRFLGYADVLGRRNIEHYAAHLVTNLATGLTLHIDQHLFFRHRTTESAFKLNGATPWGTNGNSKEIGSEVDIVLNFKTTDLVNLQLGAAFFNPGKYLEDQAEGSGSQTRFIYAQVYSEF